MRNKSKVITFLAVLMVVSMRFSLIAETKGSDLYPYRQIPGDKKYSDKTLAAEERARAVLDEMTLDEKINMLCISLFTISGVERLGISSIGMTDAALGVRMRKKMLEKTTAFPCMLALTATWNPEMAHAYAKAIGEECRAAGISVLLGPSLNLYRISQCGRNFEYTGEDPYLAGCIVDRYVRGVQDAGTMATLKHFICNNTELGRMASNSVVEDRPLRELYLRAFKAGIDAGAGAVMTSYNLLNGEWCGQSKFVITELLRNELGFKGLVMTDYKGSNDAEKIIKSGQNLVFPGSEAIKNAGELIKQEKVTIEEINGMVLHTLTACFRMGLYDRPQMDESMLDRFPAHAQVGLDVARESLILLENNSILPIDATGTLKIMVSGEAASVINAGGGSSAVAGYDHVTFASAMEKEFGAKVAITPDSTGEELARADIVVVCVSTKDSEGSDRPFALDEKQEALVKKCIAANKKTVVVVMTGSGVRMTDWKDGAGAILYALYGGQNQGTAIVDVLTGKVNPSGKLPMTIEKEFSDSPGADYVPAGKTLNSKGKTKEDMYDLVYDEGIFIGYRWYEKKNIEPLFPFGHGLSYTTFEFSGLELSGKTISGDDALEAKFTVKNTGKLAGAEVAQLYVQDMESSLERPVKELKGFQKVFLKQGESKMVSIKINKQDLSFWSPETKGWVVESGKFKVFVGSSSADIKLNAEFEYTK